MKTNELVDYPAPFSCTCGCTLFIANVTVVSIPGEYFRPKGYNTIFCIQCYKIWTQAKPNAPWEEVQHVTRDGNSNSTPR